MAGLLKKIFGKFHIHKIKAVIGLLTVHPELGVIGTVISTAHDLTEILCGQIGPVLLENSLSGGKRHMKLIHNTGYELSGLFKLRR